MTPATHTSYRALVALCVWCAVAFGLSACERGAPPPIPVADHITLHHWTYVPTPDARCADGGPTGFAINPAPQATTLLLYLQRGGACWDGPSCFEASAAEHLNEPMEREGVLRQVAQEYASALFDRTQAHNPFRVMTHVFVPYCTGDLHAGTRVVTHHTEGQARTVHHVGALNLDAHLKQLVPLLPNVHRVVLAGTSAGGLGASMNWHRVQAAFGPRVRVDVLNDAGPPVAPGDPALWPLWRDTWGVVPPPGCTACPHSAAAWVDHFNAAAPPPARQALLSYTDDATVAQVARLDAPQLATALQSVRAQAGPRTKLYLVQGALHGVLDLRPWPAPAGQPSVSTWLAQFLNDDPAWNHVGP